jgi:broad specificity phosphatase PhoE
MTTASYTGPRMAGTPVRILLARHGETDFNVEGRWQGQSDSPLTERGLAQARELGRALADEPIAAVVSSDLGRAMSTAREVAALHGLEVIAEPRLREIDVGGWTRKNGAEIDVDWPGLRERWRTAPATMRMPEGESLFDVEARVRAYFDTAMPVYVGKTIMLVGHGALNQVILVVAMGGTAKDLWLDARIDNCQISRLEWTPDDGLKLIELSDVRHLEEVGSLQVWRTDAA